MDSFEKVTLTQPLGELLNNKAKFLATPIDPEALYERFAFVREVGRGAGGETFILFDRETQYPILAKLLFSVHDREEAIGKYLASHDQISAPQIFAGFMFGEDRYLLLEELIPGPSLREWSLSKPPNYNYQIYEIITQLVTILLALANLHMVHNDIHDDNLIWSNHKLYLIDFGLSCVTGGEVDIKCKEDDTYILDLRGVRAIVSWLLGQALPDKPLIVELNKVPNQMRELEKLSPELYPDGLKKLSAELAHLLTLFPDLREYVILH